VQLPVYSLNGEVLRQIDISDTVFAVPFNEAAVHQVMIGQLANARQGTHSTKTRGQVRGSTKKLYHQKGTGSARTGSIKGPLHRGGGVIFGPEPRDYRQELPKKLRRLALRCVLSAKAGDGELKIVEGWNFEEPKTKKMIEALDALKISDSTLIITPEPEVNVIKSARNLPGIKTVPVNVLNILDMLNYKVLLITESAVRMTEKMWATGSKQGGDNASV
jgi:large subunit ribosomal protein L4